jgi:hypothetical protein
VQCNCKHATGHGLVQRPHAVEVLTACVFLLQMAQLAQAVVKVLNL